MGLLVLKAVRKQMFTYQARLKDTMNYLKIFCTLPNLPTLSRSLFY